MRGRGPEKGGRGRGPDRERGLVGAWEGGGGGRKGGREREREREAKGGQEKWNKR